MIQQEVFNQLYKDNYRKVYDFSYKLTADKHRAEDITQQCFIKLWEKISDVGKDDVFPLLFVMIKHIVIDEIRKQNRGYKFRKELQQTNNGLSEDRTEMKIDVRSLQKKIHTIVQSMPDKRRSVYRLYKEQGYSHREIASQLNISITTVRTHLKIAMQTVRKTLGTSVILLLFILLQLSCKKSDTPAEPTGPVTTIEINKWILDSMRHFYYWSESLPAAADDSRDATAYYTGLLNAADRFSFMYNTSGGSSLPSNLRNQSGLEIKVIAWPAAPGGAIGVVYLAIEGSSAYQNGFRRGQFFTRINNTVITSANIQGLIKNVEATGTGSFTLAEVNVATGDVTEKEPLLLQHASSYEPAIMKYQVMDNGGKKTAYLCYNYFDDKYNMDLVTIFKDFRQQGAQQLILDLRFSPGGSTAAAAVLAALVSANIKEESLFARFIGNKITGNNDMSFATAISLYQSGSPVSFTQIRAARLTLDNVYVLTGNHTASAAEMIINNLKPYIQVIQIGDTTIGKDEAMVIIKDARVNKRIDWVLMPVTYKIQNAQGKGGYSKGLIPDYVQDEFSILPLKNTGDKNDPLISKALTVMNGRVMFTEPRDYSVLYENKHYNRHPVITPLSKFSR